MSKFSIIRVSILFVVSTFVGCVQTPIPSAPAPSMTYNRVALLSIEEPIFYDVRIIQSGYEYQGITLPGRVAGLGISTLMKGVDQGQRNRALTTTVDYWKFKISEQLEFDIASELKKLGYEVVVVEPDYRRRARFVDDYPVVENVDSYLDVIVDFAGYVALDEESPYMPTLEVPIKLISAHDGSVVFAGTMNYGGPVPVTSPKDMPADPKYNVRGWDNLCATTECEISPAVSGLKAASMGVAELLADNIR